MLASRSHQEMAETLRDKIANTRLYQEGQVANELVATRLEPNRSFVMPFDVDETDYAYTGIVIEQGGVERDPDIIGRVVIARLPPSALASGPELGNELFRGAFSLMQEMQLNGVEQAELEEDEERMDPEIHWYRRDGVILLVGTSTPHYEQDECQIIVWEGDAGWLISSEIYTHSYADPETMSKLLAGLVGIAWPGKEQFNSEEPTE